MDLILALDVSTAIVGWALLPVGSLFGVRPLQFDAFDLRSLKGNIWQKADVVRDSIRNLVTEATTNGHKITRVCVENPLQRLRRGMSSANTIAVLARFNALVSYFAREATGVEPVYIDATAARKKIGVPLMSKKRAGTDQKEQTMTFLCETVFKNEPWPRTRTGSIHPRVYDMCDAYVIAVACSLGLGEPA